MDISRHSAPVAGLSGGMAYSLLIMLSGMGIGKYLKRPLLT